MTTATNQSKFTDDSNFYAAKAKGDTLAVQRMQSFSKDDSDMQAESQGLLQRSGRCLQAQDSDDIILAQIQVSTLDFDEDGDSKSDCTVGGQSPENEDSRPLSCKQSKQQLEINDNMSIRSKSTNADSAISRKSTHKTSCEETQREVSAFIEEPACRLTEEERASFMAPQMSTATSEFKPTAMEFIPSLPLVQSLPHPSQISDEESSLMSEGHAPEFKIKEKTELCKFWLNGEDCIFGDRCSFAHGDAERIKKVHVASKYRVTLCRKFLEAPHACMYGRRCQFCHLQADFTDFDQQRTRYQNLLTENARIMKMRTEIVADPDITTFNIAMPSKRRLAVFENIVAAEDVKPRVDRKKQRRPAKKPKTSGQPLH